MAAPGMDTQLTSPRTELDLMTEQQLARHLKICRRQLYTWRIGGLIPYFKLGKAVRFRVADVAAALERMRVAARLRLPQTAENKCCLHPVPAQPS